MQNLEKKLIQIFDKAYEWTAEFINKAKVVVSEAYDNMVDEAVEVYEWTRNRAIDIFNAVRSIIRITLIISSIGLAAALVLMIIGLITKTSLLVFVGAIIASGIFFLVWKLPDSIVSSTKSLSAGIPYAGKFVERLVIEFKKFFSPLLSIAFIFSFVSVMILIIGMDSFTVKGYAVIVASCLFFFMASEFFSPKIAWWRGILTAVVVVSLMTHILIQVFPNKVNELRVKLTNDNKEVVIKKNAILYFYQKNIERYVAKDTAKTRLKARVLEFVQDDESREGIYHIVYSVNGQNLINGQDAYVSSEAIEDDKVSTLMQKEDVKTEAPPSYDQTDYQSLKAKNPPEDIIKFGDGPRTVSNTFLFPGDECFITADVDFNIMQPDGKFSPCYANQTYKYKASAYGYLVIWYGEKGGKVTIKGTV